MSFTLDRWSVVCRYLLNVEEEEVPHLNYTGKLKFKTQ